MSLFKRFFPLFAYGFLCGHLAAADTEEKALAQPVKPQETLYYAVYTYKVEVKKGKKKEQKTRKFFCWVASDVTVTEATEACAEATGQQGELYLIPQKEKEQSISWLGFKYKNTTFAALAEKNAFKDTLTHPKNNNCLTQANHTRFCKEPLFKERIRRAYALMKYEVTKKKKTVMKVLPVPMNIKIRDAHTPVYGKGFCMGIPFYYNLAVLDKRKIVFMVKEATNIPRPKEFTAKEEANQLQASELTEVYSPNEVPRSLAAEVCPVNVIDWGGGRDTGVESDWVFYDGVEEVPFNQFLTDSLSAKQEPPATASDPAARQHHPVASSHFHLPFKIPADGTTTLQSAQNNSLPAATSGAALGAVFTAAVIKLAEKRAQSKRTDSMHKKNKL